MDHGNTTMTHGFESQIAQAKVYLEQGAREQASLLLNAVLGQDKNHIAAHNLRENYRLPGCFSDWVGVNASISPDDDIFRFFCNHPSSLNPVRDYLADGWRTMMELQEVLGAVNKPLWHCNSFLEFACGHGRFTRHLVRALTPARLAVSDVVPGSVEFLQETFGVDGFYSTTNSENLVIPQKYEVIFVLSLFSHLPFAAWVPWIAKLHSALVPGGVLVFSTHGESFAQHEGVQLEPDGTRFFSSSESTALEGEQYGTAFAAAATVKRIVQQAVGAEAAVKTLPAHFWSKQDAFMVLN